MTVRKKGEEIDFLSRKSIYWNLKGTVVQIFQDVIKKNDRPNTIKDTLNEVISQDFRRRNRVLLEGQRPNFPLRILDLVSMVCKNV